MVAALAAAGCNGSTPNTTASSPAVPVPAASGTASGAAGASGSSGAGSPATPLACENQYFPVEDGASWAFDLKSNVANASYTDTLTEVGSDGFAEMSDFGNLTRTIRWSCTHDGLAALQYGGGSSGSVSTGGTSLNFKTTHEHGVTYPTRISPGDSWQQRFTISGTANGMKVRGTAIYDFTARGTGAVTVPAGSFDALEVEAGVALRMTVSIGGADTPVSFETTGTQWLVEGLGPVKTISKGQIFGTSFHSTTNLTESNLL